MFSFTLVSTTLNEINRLDETITNLEKQSLHPNEIVITDGGSSDGTLEKLEQWSIQSNIAIKVLSQPGCNVAEGRNTAIHHASHDLIVSTDFGCTHEEDWLASLLKPFTEDKEIMVVGGTFSVEENKVKTLAAKADYILSNAYKPIVDEYYVITSRSIAYKKQVWKEIGGYPEWLTLAADDTSFWKLIQSKGFKYKIAREPKVFWLRHTKLKGFVKEAYRYGLGDGESRINQRNMLSTTLETLLRYSLIINVLLVPFTFPELTYLAITLSLLQLVGLRSYVRAFRYWLNIRNRKYNVGVFFYSLYMIERLRISYIKGYVTGYFSKDTAVAKGSRALQKQLC